MSDAGDARDKAIAAFFTTATELLKLCVPLVKTAVKEDEERRKRRAQ